MTTKVWEKPTIIPLPKMVKGIEQACVLLNGDDWLFSATPKDDWFNIDNDVKNWQYVNVPYQQKYEGGKCAYRYELKIPSQWQDKQIFLRFDGANGLTKVYLDGKFVRSHNGGFVSWDCELTDLVQPGNTHTLCVGIEDLVHDVSPFQFGGLIRDVTLYVVPKVYFSRLHVQTKFDIERRDATLSVITAVNGGPGIIKLTLIAPNGKESILGSFKSGGNGKDQVKDYSILRPLKWDSEHPYLYTLVATLSSENGEQEVVRKKIGFRQIEKKGKNVYVNGDLIKLRGINRHDIHPLSGRSLTNEELEKDVQLFKAANVNFIRTSHYPPTPFFLDLCDKYGIYVENEIAISFIGFGINYTQNDPKYEESYMRQFTELIERDYSHPCVLIWSLANESYWGDNHRKMHEYVKEVDPERLTIFSYPLTQKEDDDPVDIWSVHYGAIDSDLTDLTDAHRRSERQEGEFPVLHDECTHIPCYEKEQLQRNPGLRDFWGETIKRFWDKIWETNGVLGSAIWGGIDDAVVQGDHLVGPPWGVVDGWRRPKPEYWHMYKAYAPIQLKDEPLVDKNGIHFTLENRFNHTNLNEIIIKWKSTDKCGEILGPNVAPRQVGTISLETSLKDNCPLSLVFLDKFDNKVQEELCLIGNDQVTKSIIEHKKSKLIVSDNESITKVDGENFSISFSKVTGLIINGQYQGTNVIIGGPELVLTGIPLEPWRLNNMEVIQREDNHVLVSLNGQYGEVEVTYELVIDNVGKIETSYTITKMPYPSPRRIGLTSSIVSHVGGYDEVGVAFYTVAELDTLHWNKEGLWSVYPSNHIGRLSGTATKFNPDGVNIATEEPSWGWEKDEKDWLVFGPYDPGHRGTNDFRSLKTNFYDISLTKGNVGLRALSSGKDSARMELTYKPSHVILDRNPAIVYSGNWLERENKYRSKHGTEMWSNTKGDVCEYTFVGTGIAWYSSLDGICGKANVYINGEFRKQISLGIDGIKNPRGYAKYYQELVYSALDLPFGEHTIRIEVTGEKAIGSTDAYVNIDYFTIFDGQEIGATRFIINNEFNYPDFAWGEYVKPPIEVKTGYFNQVHIELGYFEKGRSNNIQQTLI